MENAKFICRRATTFHIPRITDTRNSLPRTLAVAPCLVGVHTAHPFEDALRIGLFNVGRLGSVATPILALPRRGAGWSLRALRHVSNYDMLLWIARAVRSQPHNA